LLVAIAVYLPQHIGGSLAEMRRCVWAVREVVQ
jgi:hypothetical protein